MKVSKEQLKVVINEELDAIMKEVDKGPDIKQLGSLPDGGYRTIRDIAAANEPSNIKRGYDDRGDYYEFYKDASPQDLIRAAVKNAGLDPNSKDGMKMVHDLEAAVDLHVKRIVDRRTNKDDLASRQPIKMTRKGTPNKQDMRDRKKDIEYKLGLGENKMKVSKEQLKALIKEELEAVMKEAESDLEEMLDDRRAKSKPGPFKKGPVGAPDKENDPAAVAYRAYRDGADREEFKQGVEDDAKKKGGRLGESEELEEVKAHEGSEEKEEHKGETKAEKAKHEEDESSAEEKKEHMKEDKQMEQIRESFRRFTKIIKD